MSCSGGAGGADRNREAFFYPNSNSQWRLPFFGGYKFQSQPGVSNLDGAALAVTGSSERRRTGAAGLVAVHSSLRSWAADCTSPAAR